MQKLLPLCAHCGKPFLPNHKKQIYHNDRCRQAAWKAWQKQWASDLQRTEDYLKRNNIKEE